MEVDHIGPHKPARPCGDAHASYSFTQPLGAFANLQFDVRGVFPHMHTLGRTLTMTLDHGADSTCMAQVDDWDFHWQELFFYDTPLRVGPSDSISMTCTYDTTGRDGPVSWGEGTQDEMCLTFLYVTRADGGPIMSPYY